VSGLIDLQLETRNFLAFHVSRVLEVSPQSSAYISDRSPQSSPLVPRSLSVHCLDADRL